MECLTVARIAIQPFKRPHLLSYRDSIQCLLCMYGKFWTVAVNLSVFISLAGWLSTCLPVCLSVYVSVCFLSLSLSLSVWFCLFVCLFLSLPLFLSGWLATQDKHYTDSYNGFI
jgi:hypothetical protein